MKLDYPSRKYPMPCSLGTPVLMSYPVMGFHWVSSLSPVPKNIPDSIIKFTESFFGYYTLMVICPSSNDWIKSFNQCFLCPGCSFLDYFTDFFSNFQKGLIGWFNKKLSFIFSKVPA